MAHSQTVKSSLFWQVLEVNSSAPQKRFNMWLLAKAQFEPEPSHSTESTQPPPNTILNSYSKEMNSLPFYRHV